MDPISDIMDYSEEDNIKYFFIETTTAWEPMVEMWNEILQKYYQCYRVCTKYEYDALLVDLQMLI